MTDFEIQGLERELNLADGHAYQDLAEEFNDIVADLPNVWTESELSPVPEAEARFRAAFASLAGLPSMQSRRFFKVCPTASNAIDIVAAVLAQLRLHTRLIEPTFDNLALLLRRRGVVLDSCEERAIYDGESLEDIVRPGGEALFLVNPNNPTGRSLSKERFHNLALQCERTGSVLVCDNSFRLYNRDSFDDYAILTECGVSFMAFEDTGKVWPTHDLKASLLLCSDDLAEVLESIYNETYLCTSRFSLLLLERFILATQAAGLRRTIWATVDKHRALLRSALADTAVTVDKAAVKSPISVEWLNCGATGLTDVELTEALADEGISVLPGRQFFWKSAVVGRGSSNIRIALMKPARRFAMAIDALSSALNRLGFEVRA